MTSLPDMLPRPGDLVPATLIAAALRRRENRKSTGAAAWLA